MIYYGGNDYRDYLAHHGVLGMKWGIRRYQPYSIGYQRKGGEGGKEIGEAKSYGGDSYPKSNRMSRKSEKMIRPYAKNPITMSNKKFYAMRKQLVSDIPKEEIQGIAKIKSQMDKVDSDYDKEFKKVTSSLSGDLKKKVDDWDGDGTELHEYLVDNVKNAGKLKELGEKYDKLYMQHEKALSELTKDIVDNRIPTDLKNCSIGYRDKNSIFSKRNETNMYAIYRHGIEEATDKMANSNDIPSESKSSTDKQETSDLVPKYGGVETGRDSSSDIYQRRLTAMRGSLSDGTCSKIQEATKRVVSEDDYDSIVSSASEDIDKSDAYKVAVAKEKNDHFQKKFTDLFNQYSEKNLGGRIDESKIPQSPTELRRLLKQHPDKELGAKILRTAKQASNAYTDFDWTSDLVTAKYHNRLPEGVRQASIQYKKRNGAYSDVKQTNSYNIINEALKRKIKRFNFSNVDFDKLQSRDQYETAEKYSNYRYRR